MGKERFSQQIMLGQIVHHFVGNKPLTIRKSFKNIPERLKIEFLK